jgi:gentisate 1,2-dioxygenase
MTHDKSPAEVDTLLSDAQRNHLVPLWNVVASLVQETPTPSCQPFIWHYSSLKPLLLDAERLVSAEMAERRVLAFDNPSSPGPGIAPTLYAGLQLLKSGEYQPPHRHTQAALRFVLEGSGAVTSVDDRSYSMEPGDLVLTPSWCWHAHEKKTSGSMVWLDGLDVPLVQFLRGSFFEHSDEPGSMPSIGDAFAHAQYDSGFAPSPGSRQALHSPKMRYPYGSAREALRTLLQERLIDPCYGVRRAYANPVDGGHVLPTIAAFLQLLPAGFNGCPVRTTENTLYCVVEGEGSSQVGEETYDWKRNDVFIVPNWTFVSHRVDSEAVLFSFSERPTLERLGLFREERESD